MTFGFNIADFVVSCVFAVTGFATIGFDSGAFDSESYEDNYVLPKIFMSAYGQRMTWNYQPHSKEHIKERNNLQHFI